MIPWILATGVLYPKTMSWAKPGSFGCHWINLSPCFQKFAGTDSSKESPKQEAPQLRGFFLPNYGSLPSSDQVLIGFGKMLTSPKTAMSCQRTRMWSLQDEVLFRIN